MPDAPQVLLVEDSEDDALLIETALRNGELAVRLARVESLEAVTAALRREPWDVVLTDFSLPGFNARDVLELVRGCCRDTAVIVVSGSVSEGIVVEIVKAGARDYIMKPNLTRLPLAVRREIEETAERRARRDLEEQLRHAQRLESLGVLAGGVAHDFNNILTGILGNASLAAEILPPDSHAMPLIETVVSAAERAALLTRQLLAYAGKGQHFIEPIEISGLARSSLSLLRVSVSRNITIGLELADGLPPVAADRGQIEQVLVNFVVNAAEAIGTRLAGGVTIRTGRARFPAGPVAGNVAGQPLAGGEYVCLEVSDTGPGIPADVQARMFDPFFSTKFTGRGLGLSAALGAIRAHGGALLVRTAPGDGTTFTTYFPVACAPGKASCESGKVRGAEDGLVLVIDGEEMVRRAAQAALQQHGLSVVGAATESEGVALLRRLADRVSLVLLDVGMAPMAGDATLRTLREIRQDVPILVSTAYTEEEARQRTPNADGAHFLQKPYGSIELALAVEQATRPPITGGGGSGQRPSAAAATRRHSRLERGRTARGECSGDPGVLSRDH